MSHNRFNNIPLRRIVGVILSALLLVSVIGATFCYRIVGYEEALIEDAAYANGAQYTQEWIDYMASQGKDPEGRPLKGGNSSSTPASKPAVKTCTHEYSSEITTPVSCVAEGVKTFTCSKCGDIYTETIAIDPNAHAYDLITTREATCTESGEIKQVCTYCQSEGEVKEIAPLGHDETVVETVDPDCVTAGHKVYRCSACDNERVEEVPALGHDESAEYTTALTLGSLKFDGKTTYTCNRCGNVRVEADASTYPMWYVYAACGAFIVLVGVIVFLVIRKKNRKES